MRSRIFFKLMVAFLLVIAAATVTMDMTIRPAWERSLRTAIERSLTEKARMIASPVDDPRQPAVRPEAATLARNAAAAAAARVTIVDRSGRVLADSEANPAQMENHASRPEFAAALRGAAGSATRRSGTLGVDFLYVAVPVPEGAIRLAYPFSAVEQTTSAVRRTLLEASALALAVAVALAGFAAWSISRRLDRIARFAERVSGGELSARIAEPGFDEIAQVATALDASARRLEQSFAELHNSRQQLMVLLESIHDGVLSVGPSRDVQWSNLAMERLLARSVRTGASLVETVRDPELLRMFDETLATGKLQRGQSRSAAPGRVFAVTVGPMPSGGAVAVLHEITDMERVEKTRRDFIANVSHELRTPLSSIQGYSETLLDTVPAHDRTTREFLEIIRKNAERMSRLAEDLLILARVESGEDRLDFQPMAASDVLEDAVRQFREIARARGIDLEITESVASPVKVDPDGIHRIFANLIENALRYGAAGRRVLLGAHDTDAGIEFYVRDFGQGIPSEHLPRIFERFYRVDRARSRESGGTGLGLAIAKHLVLAHGGSVRAESELSQGATFFFTLPLAEDSVTSAVP